jgi:peroxiredoxin family protein
MSTETEGADAPTPDDDAETDADGDQRIAALEARIDELEAQVDAATDDGPTSMVVVSTKGTLDMAYPPLILASTAAAFGWDVTVFHTFWGLDILHEERSQNLKLSSVGNPNTPMPNALATLPGMDRLTTTMMERQIADNDVATVKELLETCFEMGVELQACQMTIDLMGYDEEEFYDEVTVGVGAATALAKMADAEVQLLV